MAAVRNHDRHADAGRVKRLADGRQHERGVQPAPINPARIQAARRIAVQARDWRPARITNNAGSMILLPISMPRAGRARSCRDPHEQRMPERETPRFASSPANLAVSAA
jgi:hypothetical protein